MSCQESRGRDIIASTCGREKIMFCLYMETSDTGIWWEHTRKYCGETLQRRILSGVLRLSRSRNTNLAGILSPWHVTRSLTCWHRCHTDSRCELAHKLREFNVDCLTWVYEHPQKGRVLWNDATQEQTNECCRTPEKNVIICEWWFLHWAWTDLQTKFALVLVESAFQLSVV